MVIAYCLSGIALNHVNVWNPDFQIEKRTIKISKELVQENISSEKLEKLSWLVGENTYKFYDIPTNNHVKIYYDNATLHLNLNEGIGNYERIYRRPIFYQVNLLHRNSIKSWRWAADVFASILILINLTGLFVLKGKNSISKRGKWLITIGLLPPVIALVLLG